MKKNPKNYHHGDLRNSLLGAAREILESKGADSLSLREAAKKANVSPAAPFRHFKSKEDLLAVLAEEGFRNLNEVLEAAAKKHKNDPQAQLLELAKAYLQLAANRPHFFRMMFSVDLGESRMSEGIYRSCDKAYMALVGIFAQGQKAGQIKTGSADQQGVIFWSALHGYAMLLIDGKFGEMKLKVDQHVKQLGELLKMMFKGLEK